jgi:transcriptional regulator with XRE-family HTH domain
MIGHKANWTKMANKMGFKSPAALIKFFRKEQGYTYREIAYDLGVSTGTVWNKALDLVESCELTPEDIAKGEKCPKD